MKPTRLCSRMNRSVCLSVSVSFSLSLSLQLCNLTQTPGWHEVWSAPAASPYLYNIKKKLWVSHQVSRQRCHTSGTLYSQNKRAMVAKAGYAREQVRPISLRSQHSLIQGFGGVMIYDIGDDDWRGECHGSPFPLTMMARRAFTNRA